jgi:dipeptidyl aminopeptidase/acylaminoacyl peptidase
MSPPITPITNIEERYSRAVELTAPKVAARSAGASVEGYWLGKDLFYFLAERFDPSLGRIVTTPSTINCETGHVEEVMAPEALAGLLSVHSSRQIDLEALLSAEFDMPDRDTLTVSVAQLDCRVDLRRRRLVEVGESEARPMLFSPDGRYGCFVKDYDVFLNDRRTGAERPLTTGGEAHCLSGQQSETNLSAISDRQRPGTVGLWSPDSQWFLTHSIDERLVPELALIQHVPRQGGRPVLHQFKYPLPGDPLPIATILAVHVASGRVIRFDGVPIAISAFSPFSLRMVWFSGVDTAWFLRRDRYCKQLELIRLDLAQGSACVVVSESVTSGYIDVNPSIIGTPNVRTLPQSNEIVWFSERDGWGHLYLHDMSTGRLKNRISSGHWTVRDIVHIDEVDRKLLFIASGVAPDVDPARRSLCSVNLDGSGFEVLLAHDGDVSVPVTPPSELHQDRPFRPSNAWPGVSPSGRFAVARYASVERGDQTKIVDLHERREVAVIASALPEVTQKVPRHFTATAADGLTQLHGVMFLPSDFEAGRSYPLIDYIYPGPQVAQQPRAFCSMNSAQARALAELGFVTIMLDTRAIPVGSRALHQLGYGALLEPQLADHAAAVRQLSAEYPFIDGDRIGIFGQSGGGAATVRALCDYGGIFKVGAAACGNHDSSLYAAIWSDKYRGPEDRAAWAAQANSAVAHKLQGRLLLISGDMDENVHVSQTLLLVDALIRANKDFDLLIVPNAGHDVLMTNGYVQRRVWDHFARNLLGQVPPPNFAVSFEPHEVARYGVCAAREALQ